MSAADASVAATPVKVLTVCTHNRTRSVMMAAMLEAMLGDRLGPRGVIVRSSGFGPVGIPAIDDAVDAMDRRGLDVSTHRSNETTQRLVDGADVILTAERDHVVKIAALSPAAFRRAMTLPEFLQRAPSAELPDGGQTAWTWAEALTADRVAREYLRADVPEIADPTGSARRAFEAAVVALEQQCNEAAAWLASVSVPAST